MAQKITFGTKTALNIDPEVAEQYKIKADEINEIKTVVNANADVQVSSTDASVVNMRTVTHDWYLENWNNDTLDANTVYFTDGESYAASTSTPVGSILIWPGSQASIPINYILCDGRLLSRSEYASLFMIIGTTYGSGDGSATFAIPDYRGRFPVHLDGSTEFSSRGQVGGAKTHTLTQAQLPNVSGWAGPHTDGDEGKITGPFSHRAFSTAYSELNGGGASVTSTHWFEFGSNQAHNNLQPYVVGYYIIKVKEEVFTENLRSLDEQVQIIENGIIRENKEISCSVIQLQDVINSLPKALEADIILNVSPGTVSSDIVFEGFYGSGSISLLGATTITNTHQVNTISFRKCNLSQIYIRGFQTMANSATNISINFTSCSNAMIECCIMTNGSSNTSYNYGIWSIWSNSFLHIKNCTVSNKEYAILCSGGGRILVQGIEGTGNKYVFHVENGGMINKRTPASGITGTTLNNVGSGGVIFNNTAGTIIS